MIHEKTLQYINKPWAYQSSYCPVFCKIYDQFFFPFQKTKQYMPRVFTDSQWARKFKKVQVKKLVKSNKSITRNFF